jgi:hypothetical protein
LTVVPFGGRTIHRPEKTAARQKPVETWNGTANAPPVPFNFDLPVMKSESPIESQILDYLTANPSAQDTLRGIVEWWLLKQKIAQSTAEVEAALVKLVADGQLSAQTGPDGRVHYCHHRKAGGESPQNN